MVQIKIDPSFYSKELQSQLSDLDIAVSEKSKWFLTKSQAGNWQLIDPAKRKLEVDFDGDRQDYRRPHKGAGELIARALGIKDNIKNVVDLTAGLGIDAVFLSQIGFAVTSIERNPLLFFLLQEAQKKSQREEVKKIRWILADSRIFLTDYAITEPTSCYFDPMYPEKKKSALPRQEMVVFRELVGADEDAGSTLKLAVHKGFTRIAVKRPVKADVLLEGPDFQLTSKLVRFDVYYPRSLKEG